MRVTGTAGHIDHGKSTLVRRMTGIDPDRLAEEKQRGMTIDLGFAWLTLPSGVEVSIVDVPGHERFVRNMLAGAGGIDVALLVVAADEGIMPQTREHLEILDLLGVRAGVVALSKIDLVDEDWQEMVAADVEDLLSGSSLKGSAIVPVSAVTGEGIDDLLAALDRLVVASPRRVEGSYPYLPIDRVFTVAGFGTVVTGTLHAGSLRAGTEVEVLPSGRRARIRGLQTHRASVSEAGPGTRVAANLTGLARSEIVRGDVLALPGHVRPVRRFDARLHVLPSAPAALVHGVGVTIHIGAAEHDATLSVLGAESVEPGEEGWVQVRCAGPVVAVRGQRFIVRLPSPARTVAGGEVVDTLPRHRRFDGGAVRRLDALVSGSPVDRILAAAASNRGRTADQIMAAAGLPPQQTVTAIDTLVAEGSLVSIGAFYLQASAWTAVHHDAVQAVEAYHTAHPMRRGMPREQLRAELGWSAAVWPAVLRRLAAQSVLREEGAVVAAPSHLGGAGGRRAEADRVMEVLRANPFSPPGGRDVTKAARADPAVVEALREEGEIVRVADDLYFARDAYDAAVTTIVELIRTEGQVTVATVRDAIGTSRKYALGLLEHLDADRITRRQGDVRVLGSKTPTCA
jgi:selenocysteine-specific elongation factor